MSSPTARLSFPVPRIPSPRPSMEEQHQPYRSGTGTPRSSTDHHRPGSSSSSSRRPSTSSLHQSPTSTTSSSRRQFGNGYGGEGNGGYNYGYAEERDDGYTSTSRQQQQQHHQHRLPRITTTTTADTNPSTATTSNGPRSAPINGSSVLRPPTMTDGIGAGNYGPPLRSSSSPDPWTASTSSSYSRHSSPSNSPVDNTRSHAISPVLGPPVHPIPNPNPIPTRQQSPNPLAIPPRTSSSSFNEQNRTVTPQSSNHSLVDQVATPTGTSAGVGGGVGAGAGATASSVIVNAQVTPRSRGRSDPTYCGQCSQVVHGQFVRAMGKVYHLNCFRCKDCNKVVAQKFFPVEDQGQYPLCERDYFARLDLICAKCDQALRSSYITACGNKYHVEHFTCTECDVLFGPNDSYYEHGGKVYCHFHYSTRFAVKCVGCETAILKQFVEMNRNGRDECWHPECYMISKFWNVRLASKTFNTPANSTVSLIEMTSSTIPGAPITMTPMTSKAPLGSPASEKDMTPEELKERQEAMEIRVQQIWHVLSGYEESSAALIGEILKAVNARQLLEIILLAERFILHVETLFAVIDDLEAQFAMAGAKGMAHSREAKQLCRKLVNLFSTMSQIQSTGGPPNTGELFNLITQLAHYLKILIRIALTGSIKLEREHGNSTAMTNALARLNLLAMDNGDPTVKKRGDFPEITASSKPFLTVQDREAPPTLTAGDEEQLKKSIEALTRRPQGYISSTQSIAYGYRSLASEVTGETTLRGPQAEDFVPPEGCAVCRIAIEEDCVRLGMFNRWHSACIICLVCGEQALVPTKEDPPEHRASSEEGPPVPPRVTRRPPPRVNDFCFEPVHLPARPEKIFCNNHGTSTCVHGFQAVSRLEQYAFLLHIALRRLYVHFRIHYDLPSVRGHSLEDAPGAKIDSEVKRMKSVTLDRKLSSTARLPQRSMVVESPAGRTADANGQVTSRRSSQAITASQLPSEILTDAEHDEPPQSATVDVIRPPFARNNTSVLIIKEIGPDMPEDAADRLGAPNIVPDDDAITLGDISLLANETIRRSTSEGRPLLGSLNSLQSLIVKHFALLQLEKTGLGHLIELDEVLELLESRKGQWWNKIFKGNAKKDQKKKAVFAVPIEILVERTGSDSQQGATNDQLRVPEFIEDIISTMRQMDMAVEGIFRKNGNIRRLQQISDALDKDSTNVNLSEENPVQLAALLKRFLREMPDPLLTFRLHKLFCAAASLPNQEDRRRCLHLLVTLLPKYNRDTMEVLFVFLRWVASFSYRDEETGSRMDMANLATVICPSILYAKGANAARDESFIAINAVQELLENQDEYYYVPAELQFVISENIYSIFAKELDLPPKEIHRHCSKYMQARGPQTQRGPPSSTSGSSAQIRDRPSDTRLSNHRSEGNLNLAGEVNGSTYRSVPLPPPSAGAGPGPLQSSRPTSWIQAQHSLPGSQQSLHQALSSPSHTPFRGPFQGSANGSRNSSRGSAPSSPGPDEGRRSMNMERERSWTPVQQLQQQQQQQQ